MRFLSLLVAWVVSSLSTSAQSISLVRDINEGVLSTDIAEYKSIGATLFFIDGEKHALWKTEGDSASTQLIKYFKRGVHDLTDFNGSLYFIGDDSTYGYELWRSDGTTAGTYMVKDINPMGDAVSMYSSYPTDVLKQLGNNLYFIAVDSTNYAKLWRSDGTNAGTTMFFELTGVVVNCLSPGIFPPIAVSGNRLFFTGQDTSYCLWSTDGTLSGTVPVRKAIPYYYTELIPFDGSVYFGGDYDSTSHPITGLIKSDGTEQGTSYFLSNIQSILPGVGVAGDKLYLLTQNINPGTHYTIVATDGTVQGTQTITSLFRPLPSYSMFGQQSSAFFANIQNKMLFSGSIGYGANVSLWSSNGTPQGTIPLFDVNKNTYASNLLSVGNTVYFKCWDSSRVDLWQTDGNPGGATKITLAGTNFNNLTALNRMRNLASQLHIHNSQLFYTLTYFNEIGKELYRLSLPLNVPNTSVPQQLLLYPNPAQTTIYVNEQGAIYSVRDMAGRVLQITANNRIDITSMPAGMYIVTAENKGQIKTSKFVKQ